MKRFLLTSAAIFAMTSSSFAADLAARPYTKAPPPIAAAAPIYNWTGFYIGGHVGGAFGGENNILAPGFTGGSSNDGVFMGGVQVGYDTSSRRTGCSVWKPTTASSTPTTFRS